MNWDSQSPNKWYTFDFGFNILLNQLSHKGAVWKKNPRNPKPKIRTIRNVWAYTMPHMFKLFLWTAIVPYNQYKGHW